MSGQLPHAKIKPDSDLHPGYFTRFVLAGQFLTGIAVIILGNSWKGEAGFEKNLPAIICDIGFAVSLTSMVAFLEVIESMEFKRWLWAHRDEILDSGAVYRGQLIRADTQLTKFLFIASSFTVLHSTYACLRVASPRPWRTALFYSIITLVIGWWGFAAAIYTLLALFRNLTFSCTKPAARVLAEFPGPI